MPDYVLGGFAVYFGIGALVGIAFLAFGLTRVDPAGKGSSIFFRLLVFPGCVVLWPALVARWAGFQSSVKKSVQKSVQNSVQP